MSDNDSAHELSVAISKTSLGEEKVCSKFLTGVQAYYLKRELLKLQVEKEMNELTQPNSLSHLGYPFGERGGKRKKNETELEPDTYEYPLLTYIFKEFIRPFPFFDRQHEEEFWGEKVQLFVESFNSADISSSDDREEITKRKRMGYMFDKMVEFAMDSGVRIKGDNIDHELEFQKLKKAKLALMSCQTNDLINSTPSTPSSIESNSIKKDMPKTSVDVVGVQMVTIKRKMFMSSKKHAQFILSVSDGQNDTYVVRRYGDFKNLHEKLEHEFAGRCTVPRLPHKIYGKSNLSIAHNPKKSQTKNDLKNEETDSLSSYTLDGTSSTKENDASSDKESFASFDDEVDTYDTTSYFDKEQTSSSLTTNFYTVAKNTITGGTKISNDGSRVQLWREGQRLALRSFVQNINKRKDLTKSSAWFDFIYLHPLPELDSDSAKDVKRRKRADMIREHESKEFYKAAEARATDLNKYIGEFRDELVSDDGLLKLFDEIKKYNTPKELPERYHKLIEWMCVELAATLYHVFVGSDYSAELFAHTKHIHKLLPYAVIKNILLVSNPMMVMKSLVELFMVQPFGGKSLLQRILGLMFSDDINEQQKQLTELKKKIRDDAVCERIDRFVTLEKKDRQEMHDRARKNDEYVIITIMQNTDLLGLPPLTKFRLDRVLEAAKSFKIVTQLDDDELEKAITKKLYDQEAAELFGFLLRYMKLTTRRRDKERLMEIMTESNTLVLMKSIFISFYAPLVRVYKSANISRSVGDFQAFMDDMIQTIEKVTSANVGAVSATGGKSGMVDVFVSLVERHVGSMYRFVHDIYSHDDGFMASLLIWIDSIFAFLRDGPSNYTKEEKEKGLLDIDELLQLGKEKANVNLEVLKEEIEKVIDWYVKVGLYRDRKNRLQRAKNAGVSSSWITKADFGIHDTTGEFESDNSDEEEDEDGDDTEDMVVLERRRIKKERSARVKPKAPEVYELHKLRKVFGPVIRDILYT